MKKLFSWLKSNPIAVCTLFLTAFIPLYPKIPLLDIVQTWVSVRIEDVLVAFAAGFLAFTLLRQKRVPDAPLTLPIVLYWGVGFVSLVYALLVIFPPLKGVLFPHLALLHFLRRIEYMSVFFLAYEAFRKRVSVTPAIAVLSFTVLGIVLYGFGQKFLGFPAFLTMNEEFAKGVPLRLPPTARFPSTFGGHYDLAAYLVLTIPIIGAMVLGAKKAWMKALFFILAVGALVMLLFTASRVSFGVYLCAVSVMLLWYKKPILILPVVILSVLVMRFSSGASERFLKTFQVSDVVVDLSTGKPIGTLDKIEGKSAVLQPIESPATESLPRGSEFINLPPSTTQTPSQELNRVEMYTSQSLLKDSGDVATISGSFLIQKALVYDISITTRLQAEWPKAIDAFKRNILLGSGYSSLSVASDGDYHRMLGETGLLGSIAFLGTLFFAFRQFFRKKEKLGGTEKAFVIGLFAGITGLLLNAVLIDVFEASKVAFTLWLLLGIAVALLMRADGTRENYFGFLWGLATHKAAYFMYLFIALMFVWNKAFNLYFIGDDFTWLRWAAQSNVSDIFRYFTDARGFFYRPVPKAWYMALFSVFWLKPFAYHVLSVFMLIADAMLVYVILLGRGAKRGIAWVAALLFGLLAVHHENVYWISGQSSLLSATFLLGAIAFLTWNGDKRFTRWTGVPVVLLTALSMMSYDGMMVAPVIIWFIAVFALGRRSVWHAVLLLVPAYWFIRTASGAVPLAGDYGYNLAKLPLNAVGNGMGYLVSVFAGPSVMEAATSWRSALRANMNAAAALTAVFGAGIVYVCVRFRRSLWDHREPFIWFASGIVALAAYLGLGGMAERYVYTASALVVIAIDIVVSRAWDRMGLPAKIAVAAVCIALGIANNRMLQTVGTDWIRASNSVEDSLLIVKKETYPPKDFKNFFFVNVPIRFGRAWIYPTGMDDAIWHMFRGSGYRIYKADSIPAAYALPLHKGDREVFVFEDYQLKRGVRYLKDTESTASGSQK